MFRPPPTTDLEALGVALVEAITLATCIAGCWFGAIGLFAIL